jgi:hypothetical protein
MPADYEIRTKTFFINLSSGFVILYSKLFISFFIYRLLTNITRNISRPSGVLFFRIRVLEKFSMIKEHGKESMIAVQNLA